MISSKTKFTAPQGKAPHGRYTNLTPVNYLVLFYSRGALLDNNACTLKVAVLNNNTLKCSLLNSSICSRLKIVERVLSYRDSLSVDRSTRDREVASSNPGRSGGRLFFSRNNFVC